MRLGDGPFSRREISCEQYLYNRAGSPPQDEGSGDTREDDEDSEHIRSCSDLDCFCEVR
jgi:hypothetical protein